MRGPGLGGRFWRFWTSAVVSSAGDGLTFVAIPLLAARLTQDPAKVALVQTAEYASWLLLGLVAGALADRWDRLRIMAVTDFVRAVLFGLFALAVAEGKVGLPLLIGFAFLTGVTGILNQNAASAFLPAVVAKDKLESANSWLQAGLTVPSTLLGPPARRRAVRGGRVPAVHRRRGLVRGERCDRAEPRTPDDAGAEDRAAPAAAGGARRGAAVPLAVAGASGRCACCSQCSTP